MRGTCSKILAGRRLPALAVALGGLLSAILFAAPTAQATAIQGSLITSVPFPSRTMVLSLPHSASVAAGRVHVSEDGRAVGDLSVTSLKQARPGDLGVMIMVDTDPSMRGAPLDRALAAARTLAALRSGAEEIGIIFGNGASFPLTSDTAAINQALAHVPQGTTHLDLFQMTQAAVGALTGANIADRAIIYVTDDVDRSSTSTPQSVGAYAAAAHVRIFTVGVHDTIWDHPLPQDLPSSSMHELAQAAGGTFVETVPSQLRSAFVDIEAGLTSEYVIHYRSSQKPGRFVNVVVSVDGVAGTFNASYTAPAPAAALAPAVTHAAPTHFWTSSLAVAVVGIGAALLIGLAISLLSFNYARSGELRARVQAFTPPLTGDVLPAIATRTGEVALPFEGILERGRWWPTFVEQVDISGLKQSPAQLVYYAVGGALILGLLLWLITRTAWVGFVAFAIAVLPTPAFHGPLVLRVLIDRTVRKQRLLFQEELPGSLHEIASAMRTGRGLVEAVALVAESADEPMRRELARTVVDERAGTPIEQALRPIAQRMESTEMDQVAIVAALHRRTGANITEVLDRVADTARERVEIRRELRALTAQARISRNILTALPIVVILAIDLIGHQYEKPLFHTTAGIVVLVVAGLMILTGHRVMKSIVDIEE